MVQGTTPTFTLTLPQDSTVDFTEEEHKEELEERITEMLDKEKKGEVA